MFVLDLQSVPSWLPDGNGLAAGAASHPTQAIGRFTPVLAVCLLAISLAWVVFGEDGGVAGQVWFIFPDK